MTTQNEAAERLWDAIDANWEDSQPPRELFDEAFTAERHATVERIRAAVYKTDPTFQVTAGELSAILDEEAAR